MADAAPLCLPPRPLRNPSTLQLPAGTCDCHVHVFAAGAPLALPRSYTPRIETLDGWLALADSFRIARGVLVQPSVYGLDNSVLLAALACHPDRLRGVVVVSPQIEDAELERLHALGVRAARINLRNKAGIGLNAVAALAPRLRALDWHLQFQVGPETVASVAALAVQHEIRAVIDHLAFIPLVDDGSALDPLLAALDDPRVFTKISAPYRLQDDAEHAGYRRALQRLAANHGNKLLWGSDWPHTELFDTVPADDELVRLTLQALPAAVQEHVFVRTPELLYWSP